MRRLTRTLAILILGLGPALSANANISQTIDNLDFVFRDGLAIRAVAKEICSCMLIQQLNVDQCRAQLILPPAVLKTFDVQSSQKGSTIFVRVQHRGFVNAAGLSVKDEGIGLAHGDAKLRRFGCRIHPSSTKSANAENL